jgi:hypothetical protein
MGEKLETRDITKTSDGITKRLEIEKGESRSCF